MEFSLNQILHQEALTSAQKRMAEAYLSFAKSVPQEPAAEKKKHFAEHSTTQSEHERAQLGLMSLEGQSPTQTPVGHIDHVKIDFTTNTFKNRVEPDVRFDYFVGQKPPGRCLLLLGLSRPVMYINSTRVKKVLNESFLQNNAIPIIKDGKKSATEESQDYILDKIKELKSVLSPERKKPVVILDDKRELHRGRLKFFNEEQSYGFVTLEDTGEDVFVYNDELSKAGLSAKDFKSSASGRKILVVFSIVAYIGKNGKSKKAVDLHVLQEPPEPEIPTSPGKKKLENSPRPPR